MFGHLRKGMSFDLYLIYDKWVWNNEVLDIQLTLGHIGKVAFLKSRTLPANLIDTTLGLPAHERTFTLQEEWNLSLCLQTVFFVLFCFCFCFVLFFFLFLFFHFYCPVLGTCGGGGNIQRQPPVPSSANYWYMSTRCSCKQLIFTVPKQWVPIQQTQRGAPRYLGKKSNDKA